MLVLKHLVHFRLVKMLQNKYHQFLNFSLVSHGNTTKHGVIIFKNALHQNSSGFAVYAFERGAKSDGIRVAKPEEYEVEI